METLNSAVNQTYKNIEVIVVDNKSTDNSYKIIKDFAKSHPNVKVYQNDTNIGPVRNWRRCMDYATGEYAKILWSDDWIDKTFVEKCMEILLPNKDVGFVFTVTLIHSGDEAKIVYRFYEENGIYNTDIFIRWCLCTGHFPLSPGNFLFRRRDVEDNLLIEIPNDLGLVFEKNGAGNDMLISLLTAIRYPYFGYISEPLAHFRAHEGSISCSNDIRLYRMASKKYFVDNFINDRAAIKAFYWKMWLANLKHRGKYNQLIKKEEIDMVIAFKEFINYFRKKFKI